MLTCVFFFQVCLLWCTRTPLWSTCSRSWVKQSSAPSSSSRWLRLQDSCFYLWLASPGQVCTVMRVYHSGHSDNHWTQDTTCTSLQASKHDCQRAHAGLESGTLCNMHHGKEVPYQHLDCKPPLDNMFIGGSTSRSYSAVYQTLLNIYCTAFGYVCT